MSPDDFDYISKRFSDQEHLITHLYDGLEKAFNKIEELQQQIDEIKKKYLPDPQKEAEYAYFKLLNDYYG